MKIALFRSSSLFAAWSVAQGITEVLSQMGHEVVDCPIDPTKQSVSRSRFPNHEQLAECDGILVSGPEHLGNHIRALYPNWDTLKVPKAGWMHETIAHPVYRIVPDELKRLCDRVFCPAVQDEKHGFTYLPFGVDVNIFKPAPTETKYEVAFIGSLYAKRKEFLEALRPHLQGITFTAGMVGVQDLSGDCQRKTAELLAENYRQIKVFVNLPSMCECPVTKAYEVPACGTMLISPHMEGQNGPWWTYKSPEQCASLIRSFLTRPHMLESEAEKCCNSIHANSRLDQRLSEILKVFA